MGLPIAPGSLAGPLSRSSTTNLGRSGGGIARPGFERLLASICDGRVGAVLAIEASRLARNGRDWHTLIEFCGLVGTIIVDEDGIHDPRHPNDRLLLGMKGTMSELELSLFRRALAQEALRQKARRGALVLGVAAGYVKVGRDRSRRTRTSACSKPSGSSSRNSPSSRVRGRCTSGSETKGSNCPPNRAGGRGTRRCVAPASLQHRAQHPDQSDLCRCLCIRTHNEPDQRGGWPQAHSPRRAPADGGMGRPDQGSSRRLHRLG